MFGVVFGAMMIAAVGVVWFSCALSGRVDHDIEDWELQQLLQKRKDERGPKS